MKSKLLKSIGIAVLCLAIVLGNVLAFSLGTTDGVWGRIDSTGSGTTDATCNTYAAADAATYTMWDVLGVVYNTEWGPGGEDETYVRNAAVCGGDLDGDSAFSQYTRTGNAVWTGLGSYTNTCPTDTTGLFISEYVWNQRDNNDPEELAVEIYNGTGASINLGTAGYSLLLFTNDRDFTKVNLTGTVADDDVYVVVNTAAAGRTTAEDQTIANNDAYRTVVLLEDYVYQDITAWDTNGWPEAVQDDDLLDENQVRYGIPENASGCPTTENGINRQSGFGFEGQVDTSFEPAEGQYFPVGRFCHYNNPIYAADNPMSQVPIFLTINDISCPAGQTYIPVFPETDNDLDFEFRVNLVETTNTEDPCEYGPGDPGWPGGSVSPNIDGDTGPNRNGCADGVVWTAATTSETFQCSAPNPGYDPIVTTYTVSILGFTPSIAGAACPDVPVGTIQFNQIYTAETAKNCFCVYAAYTRGQITPVTLVNLSAIGVEDGILISWETVTEANNLGFNIMRAESVDGEQSQINPELIMSDVAPGDMFGAAYEYLDETAVEGVTYIYWLIDVPLDGSLPGVHGPIGAVR